MRMKTLTGNAISVIAPLLILVPLVYFAKGTAPSIINTIANFSSLTYVIWIIYVVGWFGCIGLIMLGFAVDGLIKGNYTQVAGAIFGPLLAVPVLFGVIRPLSSHTPDERAAKNKLADDEAMEEAHRMETERSDQDFFDRHH